MKNKKIIILLVICLLTNFIYVSKTHSQIEYLEAGKKFPIFNANTDKIINYFVLLPKEKIKLRISNVDSLRIYTRLILQQAVIVHYKYSIKIGNKKPILIEKSARLSNVSRGLDGKKVSTYNKHIHRLTSKTNSIVLQNLSKEKLLFKIRTNNIKVKRNEIGYIPFSPQAYENEKILVINDKEYTYYYSPNSQNIELTLEGPIILKIISRLVFSDPLATKYNYRFNVYDNEKLLTNFQEQAYKSAKAVFAEDKEKIPSSGDVNIIKLPAGIHHLKIGDSGQNRELIFRFYINKSAVGVTEKK
jgi:hypothetical protein